MTRSRLALAATIVGLAWFAAPVAATAQAYTNYPYCAVYESWTWSCGFNTMQQCLMTVSGRGGYCQRNPDYRPPARSQRGTA